MLVKGLRAYNNKPINGIKLLENAKLAFSQSDRIKNVAYCILFILHSLNPVPCLLTDTINTSKYSISPYVKLPRLSNTIP